MIQNPAIPCPAAAARAGTQLSLSCVCLFAPQLLAAAAQMD